MTEVHRPEAEIHRDGFGRQRVGAAEGEVLGSRHVVEGEFHEAHHPREQVQRPFKPEPGKTGDEDRYLPDLLERLSPAHPGRRCGWRRRR